MSATLTWFKDYSVEEKGYIKTKFHDADEQSIGYRYITVLNDIFKQIRCVPQIEMFDDNEDGFTAERIEKQMILPNDMVEICDTLLSDAQKFIEPYLNGQPMTDIIEWISMIREKSVQGYYVAFVD